MMAGLVSSVGLVVTLKAPTHGQGLCAAFLGTMLLVTVIAADSPVAGKRTLGIESHNMILQFVPSVTEVTQINILFKVQFVLTSSNKHCSLHRIPSSAQVPSQPKNM